MRILVDECVDRKLIHHLKPHEATTVRDAGWSGFTNGELLKRAAGEFDVFLTTDQNLQYQQNLMQAKIGVLLVIAKSNNIRAILPLVPEILSRLETIQVGEIVIVEP